MKKKLEHAPVARRMLKWTHVDDPDLLDQESLEFWYTTIKFCNGEKIADVELSLKDQEWEWRVTFDESADSREIVGEASDRNQAEALALDALASMLEEAASRVRKLSVTI